MKIKSRIKITIVGLLFLAILIFTRFYNLGYTARFTEDESKDLVGMHQIFVDRKLTLVGPTNEQGTKVFSSLTFYMLLPAAIAGKFDPVSPHYGAALWGVLTATLIIFFVHKINPKLTFLTAVLTLVWFPLSETSRWAWNPNLIPVWIISALILMRTPNKYTKFVAGVFFGFAVHNHYYAIFAVTVYMFLESIYLLYKKKYSEIFLLGLGFAVSLSPFLLFDLRHPPGIFVSNLFSQSKSVSGVLDAGIIFNKFLSNIWSLMVKYTQTIYLAIPLIIFSSLLLIQDIKRRSLSLLFLVPWVFQCLLIALIPQFFPHYLIPGLIFFLAWIVYKCENNRSLLSRAILIILILGGLLSIYPQITHTTSTPDIVTADKIEISIKKEIFEGNLKNVNIAVLGSLDSTPSGKKYRDLLLVDGDIHIMTKDEYSLSDHLFVVSTSDEKTVRSDQAAEMHRFRSGPLVSYVKIGDSGWVIYHFTRGF